MIRRPGRSLRLRRPTDRPEAAAAPVLVIAAVMAAIAVVTAMGSGFSAAPDRLVVVWAVVLAAAFWAVEVMPIHLEWSGQAYSLSLSEVPLVLGLFFCHSWLLVVARVLGGALALAIVRRQRPIKLAFNIGLQSLEASLALALFDAVPGHAVTTGLSGASPAVIAISASSFASMVAVAIAVRVSVGTLDRSVLTAFLRTGVFGILVNCSIALVLVTALRHTWWAAAPMTVMVLALGVVYRAYVSLRQRHAGLATLYEFTSGLTQTTTTDDRVRDVLERTRHMLRAEQAGLLLLATDDNEAVIRWTHTDGVLHSTRYQETAADWPFAGVMSEERSLVIPRSTKAPEQLAFLASRGFRDATLAPLRLDGQVRGVLFVADREGEVASFTADDERMFSSVAAQVSSVLDNSRLLDRLTHDSLHDALTGLANRQLFQNRLQRAMDSARPSVAVMLADLDRFKEINDTLGHHHGDLLIREIATRIAASAPVVATVARLGGDEFALLVPDYDHAAAEELGRQIRLAIAAPCQLDGVSIEVDVSIGIAVAPDDGTDASVLLKRADMAMYAAKSTHSGVQLYDEERDEYSPRRLALASRLRTAIQTGELVLYYQPQISADSGLATCAEALVRWQHPDYGLVPPSEFVPIAEQTGAIQELTAWVLGESIRQLARWKRDGLELGVSVNVSMRNLLDASTVDTVKDLLARHDVPAERLTIEITETHVMSDPARTLPLLHALAASGVRLSVDDFGTGYSSLASLGRFPVHELKIDKSFIRDPQAADGSHAIIRAIVSMSRHLGLDTVAEGVEDEAAAELLKGFGCTRLQGFHFARPMPAADLPRWYAANRMPRPRAERPALRVVNH